MTYHVSVDTKALLRAREKAREEGLSLDLFVSQALEDRVKKEKPIKRRKRVGGKNDCKRGRNNKKGDQPDT